MIGDGDNANYIDLQAPVGVFRTFAAGSFRPTAPFMTPSDDGGIAATIARLTVTIDRADMSRTRSA